MELVTEDPRVTDFAPPFVRLKLNDWETVTVTVADWLTVPPAPVHERVYVVLAVGETD